MKIITVSREFGSGGRELGKRLADNLGFDYYDSEIITLLAKNKGMDENYVEKALTAGSLRGIPLHFGRSFSSGVAQQQSHTGLLIEQKRVIESIAAQGRDFVIVGRNADMILSEYCPFNIFVCADMESKLGRCQERSDEGEKYSKREMEKKIRAIDKSRAHTRELMGGPQWGSRTAYHLTVNTSGCSIKALTPAVAAYFCAWYEGRGI